MEQVVTFEDVRRGETVTFPVKVPIEDYYKAIDLLISSWSSLRNRPVSIYQIGQVGAPGISDLDFIVVYPDGRRINWWQFIPKNFAPWVRNLMTHPPYFCTEPSWEGLSAWYPIFDLKHLWGEKLPLPSLRKELSEGNSFGLLFDYLTIKVPGDFIRVAFTRPLNVRILLGMLHSLKYTAELAEKAGLGEQKSLQPLILAVENIRTNWFERDQYNVLGELESLTDQCLRASAYIVSLVDRMISTNANLDRAAARKQVHAITGLFPFMKDWSFEAAFDEARENLEKQRTVIWPLPESFAVVLGLYGRECPEFGEYLGVSGKDIENLWDGAHWGDGLRFHAKEMVKHAERVQQLGVPSQLYIALGYPPKRFSDSLHRYVAGILSGKITPEELRNVLFNLFNRARLRS